MMLDMSDPDGPWNDYGGAPSAQGGVVPVVAPTTTGGSPTAGAGPWSDYGPPSANDAGDYSQGGLNSAAKSAQPGQVSAQSLSPIPNDIAHANPAQVASDAQSMSPQQFAQQYGVSLDQYRRANDPGYAARAGEMDAQLSPGAQKVRSDQRDSWESLVALHNKDPQAYPSMPGVPINPADGAVGGSVDPMLGFMPMVYGAEKAGIQGLQNLAGANGPSMGDTYSGVRQAYVDERNKAFRDHPVAATATALASGLTTPGMGLISDAIKVPTIAERVIPQAGSILPVVTKGLSYAERTARAAGAGYGLGAAYGYANGPAGSQAQAAQQGGNTGALTGGAIHATSPVLAAVVKRIATVPTVLANTAAPFSDSGRASLADQAIAKVAAGGPTTIDAREIIPGSRPTLAEATGNPALATMQKTVAQTPGPNVQAFTARMQANNAARQDFLKQLRGDGDTIQSMEDARDANADAARSTAFQNAGPADATDVVGKIDSILASPSGQRDAVTSTLSAIRKKLVTPVDLGNGQTVLHVEDDPEQLYGVRSAIGDLMSPKAALADPSGQLAAKELIDVRNSLDQAIEGAAPGYKGYLQQFASASSPINSKRFLQGLNLTDAQGNPTLQKVTSALEQVRKAQLKPGISPAKSVTPDDLGGLQQLQADLQRQTNLDLGKPRGSDTTQHLATQNMVAKLGIPAAIGAAAAHHSGAADALLPMVAMGARKLYSDQNAATAHVLAERLLNPGQAAPALTRAQRASGTLSVPQLAPYGAQPMAALTGSDNSR